MIERQAHGEIVELRMDRPPANALNTALVTEVTEAVADAVRDGAPGIVLSGRPGMFSGGIDVPELLALDRTAVEAFWRAFFRLTRALAGCPVPVAAAVTGHSPAGGAVLAVHCDYRVAASGNFKIGFNEVRVGLPVPSTILEALGDLVGVRHARRLATTGVLMPVAEALEIGLVDQLAAPDAVVGAAVEWVAGLTALPRLAMNATRLAAKAPLLAALDRADDARVATDYWFSAETRGAMTALAERLNKG